MLLCECASFVHENLKHISRRVRVHTCFSELGRSRSIMSESVSALFSAMVAKLSLELLTAHSNVATGRRGCFVAHSNAATAHWGFS